MGGLRRRQRFNRTVVRNVATSITNSADPGRTVSGGMSPSITKVASESETRVLGVTRGGEMTMGTNVFRAILTVVTQTMTPKALGGRRCGSSRDRDLYDASGSREDLGTVFQLYHERSVVSEDSLI